MKEISDIIKAKLIFLSEIKPEIHKKRDNGEWGPISDALAGCLVHIECEIDKKFTRLKNGESIYEILPDIEFPEDYDKLQLPVIK